MATEGVRPLTAADLDWVLDLLEPRRAQLKRQAPHFWNPAANARELHSRFLARQIDLPEVVTLRTDHGFVFAAPRQDGFLIDDMLVEPADLWASEGGELIRAAADGHAVRLVCPVHERFRAQLAESLGLTATESWWTRDLDPVVQAGLRPDPPADEISAAGTTGRLVTAPPVYAPGGPVLILANVSTADALAAAEHMAEAAGSPVAVVPHRVDDQARGALLEAAGYRRTTDYYDGVPT